MTFAATSFFTSGPAPEFLANFIIVVLYKPSRKYCNANCQLPYNRKKNTAGAVRRGGVFRLQDVFGFANP